MKVLVLSGGGVLGALHLGALHHRFCEHRYDIIAGTSVGAIIGALLAVGYEPMELLRAIPDPEKEPLVQPDIQGFDHYGAASSDRLMAFLEKLLRDKCDGRIMTLREVYTHFGVDLIITGTNLTRMSVEYFHRHTHPYMYVLDALRITCCVPLLFPYVEYKEQMYVDGFVTDNFPLAFARKYVLEYFPEQAPDAEFHAQNILRKSSLREGFHGFLQSLFCLFLESKSYDYGPVDVWELCTQSDVSMTQYTRKDLERLFLEGFDHLKNNERSTKGNDGPSTR